MSAVPAPVNPGKTMGIVALVLSLIGLNVVGIIVGFVGLNQSKKAGQKNGLALAGIIIGFVSLLVAIIVLVVAPAMFVGGIASFFGGIAQVCMENGTGVWEIDGVTYTCE